MLPPAQVEILVLAGRIVTTLLVLAIYVIVATSRLIEGKFWLAWTIYLLALVARDSVRLFWLNGSLSRSVFAPVEWATTFTLRIAFVSAFLLFGGKPLTRSLVFWAAVLLGVVDAFAEQGPVMMATDGGVNRFASNATGPLFMVAILVGSKSITECRTKIPCLLTGLLFSGRYFIWSFPLAMGWVTASEAHLGSLMWGSMTNIIMLMCFMSTVLLTVARERYRYEQDALDALAMAATYMERQSNVGFSAGHFAYGRRFGRTESTTSARVTAGASR